MAINLIKKRTTIFQLNLNMDCDNLLATHQQRKNQIEEFQFNIFIHLISVDILFSVSHSVKHAFAKKKNDD